jgi:predicted flap endonuclease-1-like 5' DNA nuclease
VAVRIEEVEGIGPTQAASLREAGVGTTEALLEQGATPIGRAALASTTGVGEAVILKWVNHVDLMRIDGVGSEYSDLLEAAGVDSPAELAQRNAANLAQTFQELDAARPDWIRSLPSVTTVEGWIAQARALPKLVTHGGGGGGGTSTAAAAAAETTSAAGTTAPAGPAPPATEAHTAATPSPAAAAPVAPPEAAPMDTPPDIATTSAPAEPVAFAAPVEPEPSPEPLARSAAGDATGGEGLWARIKRFFGG